MLTGHHIRSGSIGQCANTRALASTETTGRRTRASSRLCISHRSQASLATCTNCDIPVAIRSGLSMACRSE